MHPRYCRSSKSTVRSIPCKGRQAISKIDANHPLRYAIEVRHESFIDPGFIDLLSRHNVAVVISESARQRPMIQDVTADFVNLRLHGDKQLYRSGGSDKALDRWAGRIAGMCIASSTTPM